MQINSYRAMRLKKIIHFIGIGGIGISGIAEVMHNLGYQVQGSDIAANANTERLTKLGIKIFYGHNQENIKNVEYIVISTAITPNNPELIAAAEEHIPVIRRAEMLAELLRFKTAVAISGSHGKTTTTSLTAAMFEEAGLNPTVINGGIINNKATNAYVGNGEYVVVEADESDSTFIKIPATIGVITNIDPEHLEHYGSFANLLSAFRQFITNLPFYGFAVACIDHKTVRELIQDINSRKIITYGIESNDANIIGFNLRNLPEATIFDVKIHLPHSDYKLIIENIKLAIPGRHNVLNALATIAIAAELDLGPQIIKRALGNFHGVKRRFTTVAEHEGIKIIDDYAHHPAEVKATLQTAKNYVSHSGGKIIAIFQPHRYTRLHSLFNEFVGCFNDADLLYISEVYSAGEEPIAGANTKELIAELLRNFPDKHSAMLNSSEEIMAIIQASAKRGDLVLMMGAGSITQWAANIAKELEMATV